MQTITNVRKKYLIILAVGFLLVCYSIKRSIGRISTVMIDQKNEMINTQQLIAEEIKLDDQEQISQEFEDLKIENELAPDQRLLIRRSENEQDMIKNIEMQAIEEQQDRLEMEGNEREKHDYNDQDYHGQIIEDNELRTKGFEELVTKTTPQKQKNFLGLFFKQYARQEDDMTGKEIKEALSFDDLKLSGNESKVQSNLLQLPIEHRALPEGAQNFITPETLPKQDPAHMITLSAPILIESPIQPQGIHIMDQEESLLDPDNLEAVPDPMQPLDIHGPNQPEMIDDPIQEGDMHDPNHPDPMDEQSQQEDLGDQSKLILPVANPNQHPLDALNPDNLAAPIPDPDLQVVLQNEKQLHQMLKQIQESDLHYPNDPDSGEDESQAEDVQIPIDAALLEFPNQPEHLLSTIEGNPYLESNQEQLQLSIESESLKNDKIHPNPLLDNILAEDIAREDQLILQEKDYQQLQDTNPNQPDHKHKKEPERETDHLKKILYWNDAYSNKGFFFGFGQEPFLKAGCEVATCYTTHDRTAFDIRDIDAVLWHIKSQDQTLPAVRSPHTFYVLWMIESPAYNFTENVLPHNRAFNWTFTTRTESDFPHPSGIIHYKTAAELQDSIEEPVNYAESKKKLVSTIIHECESPSQREILISNLQQLVTVDVYGDCGTRECSANDWEECHKRLAEDFKFYLSFESVLCNDYITEDFFEALRFDLVPVVYGFGYHNLDLPEKSYINVFDFSSTKELVDYLNYLDKNDTAYNEYLSWKTTISKISIGTWDNSEITDKNFCDMCKRLHQADTSIKDETMTKPRDTVIDEKHRKTYKNMHQWLVKDQCVSPDTDKQLELFINDSSESNERSDKPLSHLAGERRKSSR